MYLQEYHYRWKLETAGEDSRPGICFKPARRPGFYTSEFYDFLKIIHWQHKTVTSFNHTVDKDNDQLIEIIMDEKSINTAESPLRLFSVDTTPSTPVHWKLVRVAQNETEPQPCFYGTYLRGVGCIPCSLGQVTASMGATSKNDCKGIFLTI